MNGLDLIKADFKNCLYVIWKHLQLPQPTPIQYEIADFLQYGGKRKMVEAFRGVGKSWITSAYALWRLLKDPEYKILVVSASKSRSDDFAAFTKRLINDMSIFKHLKAKPKQRDSMIAFDVGPCKPAHAPSVKSAGIFGQLSGSRANEIIADDVEVPNNSATEDMREKLEKATTEFEAIIVPGGMITYLGTPQSEESIYNNLPKRGYDVRIWPARYPSENKLHIYNGHLAPSIVDKIERQLIKPNEPTDPLRFNEVDLLEREASYGKSGFALQFMLDTSLSDAEKYPLKTGDLVVMSIGCDKAPVSVQYANSNQQLIKELPNVGFTGDRWYRPFYVDKEWTEFEGSVMFIDPSGRGKDETGYAVVKQLHGYLYVTAAGGLKGGYEDNNLKILASIAKEQKVNLIQVESNFGDGMFNKIFQPVLQRVYPNCRLDEIRHSIQKEKRIIDTLEPVLNRHKLIVDFNVVRDDVKDMQKDEQTLKYSLFYQLTRITKDRGSLKHDDRLDALAGAVAYWVNSMSRDEQLALEAYKERELDKELNNFINHVVDSKYKPKSNKFNSLF